MAIIDFTLLLERNYPTALFGGSCATYDKIHWKDTTIPKPTLAQLTSEWAVLEVQLAIEDKIQLLSQCAYVDITKGFYSNATGTSYFYDANLEDQLNLIGVVADGQASMYSVRTAPTDVSKTYVNHTATQLKSVMNDGKIFKLTILMKFNALKEQALLCTTTAEVAAIVW